MHGETRRGVAERHVQLRRARRSRHGDRPTRRCSATEPHDLSRLIKAQRDVFKKLAGARGAAPGPDLELQHDDGRPRRRAGELSATIARAGADARAGRARAAHLSDVAAAAPRAWRPSAGAERAGAAGDDRGRPARGSSRPTCCCATRSWAASRSLLGDSAAPLAKATDDGARAVARAHRAQPLRHRRARARPATSSSTTPFSHRPVELPRVLLRRRQHRRARRRSFDGNGPFLRAPDRRRPDQPAGADPEPAGGVPGNTELYGTPDRAARTRRPAGAAAPRQPPFRRRRRLPHERRPRRQRPARPARRRPTSTVTP